MNVSRAFPAFSIGFGICYLISMAFHPTFTIFAYAPRLGQWFTGVPALGANAPGMFWWSWLTTGAVGGLVFAASALAAPDKLRAKAWSGWVWVVPVTLTVIVAYIERPWFGFKAQPAPTSTAALVAQPEIAAVAPAESAKGATPPPVMRQEQPATAPEQQAQPAPTSTAAPAQPEIAAEALAGASSYTIVFGDTLRGIAAKLFHDTRRWRDIAAVNPGLDAHRRLSPGQVIKLPGAGNEGGRGR